MGAWEVVQALTWCLAFSISLKLTINTMPPKDIVKVRLHCNGNRMIIAAWMLRPFLQAHICNLHPDIAGKKQAQPAKFVSGSKRCWIKNPLVFNAFFYFRAVVLTNLIIFLPSRALKYLEVKGFTVAINIGLAQSSYWSIYEIIRGSNRWR